MPRTPKVTAAVVAATLLLLKDDDELGHLVDRASLASVERAVRELLPAAGVALDRVPWPLLKRAAHRLEALVSPGFVAHYALRKHAIRKHLADAVADGFRQIVLVGAGFDMMSASLPEGLRVFEVDHPSTQQAKRKAIGIGREVFATFVPVDLARGSLGAALRSTPGFSPAEDTVVVAEGVLMYLEKTRVEAVFKDISAIGRRTRVIFSVVTPDARGRLRLHSQHEVIDLCMGLIDERFLWGAPPEQIRALLARHGLGVVAMCTTTELRDRELAPTARRRLPHATGEVIVVAQTV